jgi:hypothetical protein
MSRAARNSKVLRSGAIGFVAGLATLGVVAHGSPAHGLVSSALGSTDQATSLALGAKHHARSHGATQNGQSQQSLDAWLQQQLSQSQQAQPQYQQPQQQQAQPQYQQPQQQYVQPAPSQQPQSQAS